MKLLDFLDAIYFNNPVFFWVVVAGAILFAAFLSLAWKPRWKREQEAVERRMRIRAARALNKDQDY